MTQRPASPKPSNPPHERSPMAATRSSDRRGHARAGFSALENDFFDRGIELTTREPEAPESFDDLE